MLRPKSLQNSFYGSYPYERIIPDGQVLFHTDANQYPVKNRLTRFGYGAPLFTASEDWDKIMKMLYLKVMEKVNARKSQNG